MKTEHRRSATGFRRGCLGAALLLVALPTLVAAAQAAPCMMITLTGTQGGPPAFKGLAGPGTLVRYGDDTNNCSAVKWRCTDEI